MIVALAHVIFSRRVKSTYLSMLSVIMRVTIQNSENAAQRVLHTWVRTCYVNTYEAYS